MIKIIPYETSLKGTWNEFVKKAKNGIFMFEREFMDYHAHKFEDNSLLFYKDDELIALLPLSKHKNTLKSHGGLSFGGFISDENMKQNKMNECVLALCEYLKTHKFKALIYKKLPHIYSEIPSDEDKYALFKMGAKCYKIEPSTTLNLKFPLKMSKGRKAQISRAKRENVEILESNDFENFIKLENEILLKYNTKAVHNASELALLKGYFNEQIKLFLATKDDEILAAALLFIYPKLVHTQYLANSEKGRQIGALDLLIASLIDKFKDNKIYFDFGISSEKNGLFLNEGLIAQKESFGGRTLCFEGWELMVWKKKNLRVF